MRIKTLAEYVVILAFALSTQAQGTFQNLNFESATVLPSPQEFYPNFVPIASALPGWTAYLNTAQQTQVGYNTTTLGTASISLLGPTWNSADTSRYAAGIIDGQYSVIIQSGNGLSQAEQDSASITQSGTVPANAQSLQFNAYLYGPLSAFAFSFAGNALTPIQLSSGVSADGLPYTVYGANISPWAGQTGQLEFTANYQDYDPYMVLDDITFSTSAVPEPDTLALMLMGGAAFAVRCWGTKRR